MKKLLVAFLLGAGLITGCDSGNQPAGATMITIGSGADQIPVIVVSGTAYEMGYQLGQKLGEKINACLGGFLEFAGQQPQGFSERTLDKTWEILATHIDERIKEEMRGLADGSGFPLVKIQRAHAIPALADFACSGVALWGKASIDGHLYHLRNLDFIKQAHLQDYPVIVIYRPKAGQAHTIATFAGYVGAHSGMNERGIVLGEKGESPHSEAPFDVDGVHFSFLFRQILYDAQSLQEAASMIETAPLIKRYFFYVSDGKPESMGAVKYQISTPDTVKLRRFSDADKNDNTVPGVLPDCIYYTMDNQAALQNLQENSGTFDAEKMIALSRRLAAEGGNLLNIIYDATALRMWVAYAGKNQDAASREYVELQLLDYLNP